MKFRPDVAARIQTAGQALLKNPLSKRARLRGVLAHQYATLYGVDPLDLENFSFAFDADPAWFQNPSWPAGCSVGGGVAAVLALLGEEDPSPQDVQEHNRRIIHTVASITSEGSAAGYDSHGIVLTVLDLKTREVRLVRARTPGDIDERGHYTIQALYKKEPGLSNGTCLILVTAAQTRAATQGDNMYSRANAHPHYDWANRDPLMGALSDAELQTLRESLPTRLNAMGPFAVGHNGDVNSKLKWERFFFAKGFYTDADADSKELPRILRIVWEALRADQKLGGHAILKWLISELYEHKVLAPEIMFHGRPYSQAEVEKDLIAMLGELDAAQAGLVAQASAVGAKLISWCDSTSVYVFEALTDLDHSSHPGLPETILVRGPKAGGMVLYHDKQDPTIPIKYASSLSNLRGSIKVFDNQVEEKIPVDYIATGARVNVREGTVQYQSLSDWQMCEIVAPKGQAPEIRYYDILSGKPVEPPVRTSPIIDYVLRGARETAVLKAEGEFAGLPVSERTVSYDTILGEVLDGPPSLQGRQIKNFPTEERPRYAVDNQYAAEILLSVVALKRNTAFLFEYTEGKAGAIEGPVYPRPRSLFRQDEELDRNRLRKILKKISYVVGLGEGTSRNVAGIASSCANHEGISDLILDARESNLARTEAPRLDEKTMVVFISNSGGTKPVVALAEEILKETGDTPRQGPFVWAVTNISTSELATLAHHHLGASITNLPWEKAVGSTYAAFTALQNILTMLVYVHQVRGAIRPGRARHLYRQLASFPTVIEQTLSSSSVKAEVDRLARHVAGSAVDIAFVGPLGGFDAAEAALKFAEMMQHSRVKFYSGAYEQHGQRATYLRSLHANPGTLVVLLVPNLETSIGSWMAQLIQENKPRAGKIAVLCSEEDSQALREAGADYVIAAPKGCTESMFTDALSKMIMANMLTEATIRWSNDIAGRIRGWGSRLLSASSALYGTPEEKIASLKEELEVIRAQFTHLRDGDFGALDRRRILVETEKQLENEIIDQNGREAKLRQIYLQSRRLTLINPAQLDRVSDLIQTLLQIEIRGDKDSKVFENLLNDLILEFSDRSLAMLLAEERFAQDAPRARQAVHYQGMSKIIGANPIKPDNIAKFQQGWGIPSFLLPPGTRRSDPTGSLSDVLTADPEAGCGLDRRNLLRLGFSGTHADIAEAFLALIDVEKSVLLEPEFSSAGRAKAFQIRSSFRTPELTPTDPEEHGFELEEVLVETVTTEQRSALCILPTHEGIQLQLLATDRFGDISQGLMVAGDLRPGMKQMKKARREIPLISKKLAFLESWMDALPGIDPEQVLSRMPIVDLIRLGEKELLLRLRELVESQKLADDLKFSEPFQVMGVDPARASVKDLKTLHNIFHAVTSIHSGACYDVQTRWEEGRKVYWATRRNQQLYKAAQGRDSSYDDDGKELHGNKLIAVVGRQVKMGFGRDGTHTLLIPVPGDHGEIAQLVLMHPEVDENLSVPDRIRTLGDKYRNIKNNTSEYIEWSDDLLEKVSMVELLMLSDEEIASERIVPLIRGTPGSQPPRASFS